MPLEKAGVLLEQAKNRVLDRRERTERVRIDGLLSTLKPLGITDHLPRGQACSPLAKLKDVEDGGDPTLQMTRAP